METITVTEVPGEVNLSSGENEILNLVGSHEMPTLPLENVSSRMEEVRRLVSSCHLRLLVVEYPWGVQFEIGLSKKGADYLANRGKIARHPEMIQEAMIA